MGVIKRQSILSSIYAYSGIIIGFVTTALLLPRFLTTDQNGLLKLLVSYSTIFGQFATLGISHVTIKFFPYFKNKSKKHNGYLSLLVLLGLLGFAIFLIIFLSMKPWLIGSAKSDPSLFVQYLPYIVPLTLFTLFFNLLDTYLRSLYEATYGSFLREIVQRFLILFSIMAFVFDLISFKGFVIAYCTALSLPTVILAILIMLQGQLLFTFDIKWPQSVPKKEAIKVASFGLITGFSYLAIVNIDSIMINQIKSTAMTGIYAITSYFGVLVSIPSRSFLRIGSTVIANSFKENDIKTIKDIYIRSCLNQFIIGALLLLGIWLNIDNVFLILPQDYLPGKYVILFMGISNLIIMAGGANTIIISNSNFYSLNAYATMTLVVLTIITNWIFIPIYGIVGAAFASALSMAIFNLMKFITIYIKLRLQPYSIKFLYIIIIGLVTAIVVTIVPKPGNLYLNLLWVSTLTTLLFAVPILLFKISPDMNILYQKLVNMIKLK